MKRMRRFSLTSPSAGSHRSSVAIIRGGARSLLLRAASLLGRLFRGFILFLPFGRLLGYALRGFRRGSLRRRRALSRVVGDVPARALELDRGRGGELLQLPATVRADLERLLVEGLQDFGR